MKRVLVVNECASDNIGDQAIAYSIKKILTSKGVHVTVKDYSFRKLIDSALDKTSVVSRKNSVSRLKLLIDNLFPLLGKMIFAARKIPIVYSESKGRFDSLVIGGGQLILSNRRFSICCFLWVLFFWMRRKNIYFLGIGVGSDFDSFDCCLYKWALSKASIVICRDEHSRYNLDRYFSIKAVTCPDVVYYLFDEHYDDASKRNWCLIGIVSYTVYVRYSKEASNKPISYEEYIDLWKDRINSSLETYDKVVLVSTTVDDLELSSVVAEKVKNDRVCFYEYVPSFKEYVDISKKCRMVYSGRMHALILGQIGGADVVPFLISNKIINFKIDYLDSNHDLRSLKENIISQSDLVVFK